MIEIFRGFPRNKDEPVSRRYRTVRIRGNSSKSSFVNGDLRRATRVPSVEATLEDWGPRLPSCAITNVLDRFPVTEHTLQKSGQSGKIFVV